MGGDLEGRALPEGAEWKDQGSPQGQVEKPLCAGGAAQDMYVQHSPCLIFWEGRGGGLPLLSLESHPLFFFPPLFAAMRIFCLVDKDHHPIRGSLGSQMRIMHNL